MKLDQREGPDGLQRQALGLQPGRHQVEQQVERQAGREAGQHADQHAAVGEGAPGGFGHGSMGQPAGRGRWASRLEIRVLN